MTERSFGELEVFGDVPERGELHVDLAQADGFRVETILSGRVDTPVEFIQAHDEWVVVLEGEAVLEVAGESVTLRRGGWMLVPASVPHVLVRVAHGTRWLAVHGRP